MARVQQEWYCTKSGGGCGGYIVCKINIAINGIVEMVCPKCGHKHRRNIKDGVIMEELRFSKSPTQEICPTMAAYSNNPRLKATQEAAGTDKERDGVVITEGCKFLKESWFEKFGAAR